MSAYPTKNVVATDGSDESKLAGRRAAELAAQSGAELHVIHVGLLSPWTHPDTLSPQQYQRLKDEAQRRLEGEVKDVVAAGGDVTESYVRMGRVDGEVIKLTQEIGGDLIVVGNRGVGSLTRILLGNDAESIVRHAHCPVLVVRKPD